MRLEEHEVMDSLNLNKPLLDLFVESMKLVAYESSEGGKSFQEDEVTKLQQHILSFGLSTKEAAARAGVTEQTIKKRLQPWNKDTWRIDGTFLYPFEKVVELANEMNKPGLTANDVVVYLQQKYKMNLSNTTVYQRIKAGDIPSTIKKFRGIETHFIQPEDIDAHIDVFTSKLDHQTLQDPVTGYYLFQPFINPNTKDLARILELDGERNVEMLTSRQDHIPVAELGSQGYQALYTLSKQKRITKKGHLTFKFTKPKSTTSKIYSVIDFFYQHIGPQNMKIKQTDEHIFVDVKPKLIPLEQDEYQDEIELIKSHIIEGKISTRPNGLALDTELEAFVGWGKKDLKEKAKHYAALENLDLEEFIMQCLKEGISRRENSKG